MRFFSLIVTCLLAVGCKDATKDFENLADKACACAMEDAACGNQVIAEVVKFAEHNKSSDGDQQRITHAGVRLNECLMNTGVKQPDVTAALERLIR